MMRRRALARARGRLLAPVTHVAAGLMLLAGSVVPAAPVPGITGLGAPVPAATAGKPDEPSRASMTEVPERRPETVSPTELGPDVKGPGAGAARFDPTSFVSGSWSVPTVLLAAYRNAVADAPPSCHLPVSLLAAIGQVESGSMAGRSLDATHAAVPRVLGLVLDGVSTAAIPDTDGGRLDGNSRWDRAVGPMQFLPGTWAVFGVDADGDGRADPQNVYDAAAAAGHYLCAGGGDLALSSDVRSAVLSYNHSLSYLSTVLGWQHTFSAIGSGAFDPRMTLPAQRPGQAAKGPQLVSVSMRAPRGGLALTDALRRTPVHGTSSGTQPVIAGSHPAGLPGSAPSTQTGLTPSDGSTASTGCCVTTPDAGTPATVTVVAGSAQTTTAGEVVAKPVVVRVTDANANPVPAVTVTFTVPPPGGGASGTFANATSTSTVTTGADGQATSGELTANTIAGSFDLIARTGPVSATVALTNVPGAATTFVIVSAPVSGLASVTATVGPIRVQSRDSYGNPAPAPAGGLLVTLFSDSVGDTVFATSLAGDSVPSVTIPGGASSVVFYYGDTMVASPLITASGMLTSATQTETITAPEEAMATPG